MAKMTDERRRAVGLKLQNWHAGMGDPIYAVGSYWFAGKRYPDRSVVEQCLTRIEALLPKAEAGAHGLGPKDVRELRSIHNGLRDALDAGVE